MPTNEIQTMADRAAAALRPMLALSGRDKREALHAAADAVEPARDEILAAAAADRDAAAGRGRSRALLARLEVTEARFLHLVRSIRTLADLPDPVGERVSRWVRPNGLEVERIRVPLGLVGVCAESRPLALPLLAAACLKAGDAVLFVTDAEARATQEAFFGALLPALAGSGVPDGAVQLLCECDPLAAARELVSLEDRVDAALLRGSAPFVRDLCEHATIPVLFRRDGICHVYVDRDRENPDLLGRVRATDLRQAVGIVLDSRLFEPYAANAATVVLVHRDTADRFLPMLAAAASARGLELRADERAAKFLPGAPRAEAGDFHRVPEGLALAVGVVDGLDEAAERINRNGARLSDAIVTGCPEAAVRFQRCVDSATVCVNASTTFTDGSDFGMGAEIGLSTGKLDPRGAIGLTGLTSLKYVVRGDGQTRRSAQ